MEAVKTNILGTDNVLSDAIEMGIKGHCLSTDKATSNKCYGNIKLMEKVFVAKQGLIRKNLVCKFVEMVTRGSVIPLFINQIKIRHRLTGTNPNDKILNESYRQLN